MPLALPNLDDRRWSDLVEEARALIPLYAPEWTDHNVHDPGITLIELLAWIAEMDLYQLNRIPATHRQKFLALLGFRPEPPRPARTVLSLSLPNTEAPLHLPAGVIFAGHDPFGQMAHFQSLEPVTVTANQFRAIQAEDKNGFFDLTARMKRGETIAPFGLDPVIGNAFYLGFRYALPVEMPVTLFFTFAHTGCSDDERQRLMQEIKRRQAACVTDAQLFTCAKPTPPEEIEVQIPPHHSVRACWEFLDQSQTWQVLDAAIHQVEDDTRSFTLDGWVRVRVPALMGKKYIGSVAEELCYLRCRLLTGAYDTAPILQNIALNGIRVEQATPVGNTMWMVAKDAVITGEAPTRGDYVSFLLRQNERGEIIELHFKKNDHTFPKFLLLEYEPPTAQTEGRLCIEAERLADGLGTPWQEATLSQHPVVESTLRLFTLEQDQWRSWALRPDFDTSRRIDAHFLLDASAGIVRFGDGEKARVLPTDALVNVTYQATRAQEGNLAKETIKQLEDSAHNQALLKDEFQRAQNRLQIGNPLPATGGRKAEDVEQTAGRALDWLAQPQRAVTLTDYEFLAKKTPGVQLAQVSARANLHPGFLCLQATGIITLVVLPYLPLNRPAPSNGLLQAVTAYLTPRRIIGSRVEVVGPVYQEVTVRAQVRALAGTNRALLQQRIITAINEFFHPLQGGPNRTGWPLGRDVYRAEVLQVLDEVPGVDHVLSLELVPESGESQCGNLCIGPLGLVAAGEHEIEVI